MSVCLEAKRLKIFKPNLLLGNPQNLAHEHIYDISFKQEPILIVKWRRHILLNGIIPDIPVDLCGFYSLLLTSFLLTIYNFRPIRHRKRQNFPVDLLNFWK